ncbi:MAG TPA: VOC family protein [Dehalococcoidia bacterium]|nr:VOC family protein [Dehalococcoidia bacterium]
MERVITRKSAKSPLLQIKFMSHGTLECVDLQATRSFYEDVLGLEVIQHAPEAMMVRRGGDHIYVVLATGKPQEMRFTNHNGLDVGSRDEVDRAYERLQSVRDEYNIHKLSKPNLQHGAYSFYFQDFDNNWWEILANPPGGYSPMFDRPEADLTAPG